MTFAESRHISTHPEKAVGLCWIDPSLSLIHQSLCWIHQTTRRHSRNGLQSQVFQNETGLAGWHKLAPKPQAPRWVEFHCNTKDLFKQQFLSKCHNLSWGNENAFTKAHRPHKTNKPKQRKPKPGTNQNRLHKQSPPPWKHFKQKETAYIWDQSRPKHYITKARDPPQGGQHGHTAVLQLGFPQPTDVDGQREPHGIETLLFSWSGSGAHDVYFRGSLLGDW